jgi:hypothetical protein
MSIAGSFFIFFESGELAPCPVEGVKILHCEKTRKKAAQSVGLDLFLILGCLKVLTLSAASCNDRADTHNRQ